MSRRPPDRAAQNQQTIKSLLKLEANKHCADCKRNKHPRWASWNLGIFICIRCSGIHRGMGTHISRVKSVDLDAWTDEQLQSVLKWGNTRANKYWEAKLAAGHVPSEAKIENFIRTKYESKRWIMDGPMPDPSTLDAEGDDDVPLNIVQEKAKLERSSSQHASSAPTQPGGPSRRAPATASLDILGGDDIVTPPVRPSTTDTPNHRPPPARAPAQPSQLLGGLDFLGGPPESPASGFSKPAAMSRPDLKQSILSLYSSAPKPPQSQPLQETQLGHARQDSSSGTQAPSNTNRSSGAFGGLQDAFSDLGFSSTSSALPARKPSASTAFGPGPTAQPARSSAYAVLSGIKAPARSSVASPQLTSPPPLGGGDFFDGYQATPKPVAPKTNTAPPLPSVRKISNAADDFGDFSVAPAAPAPAVPSSNGLLDFSSPRNLTSFTAPAVRPASTTTAAGSIFNLSTAKAPTGNNYTSTPRSALVSATNAFSDPWASNEWASNEPAAPPSQTNPSATKHSLKSSAGVDFGWSSSPAPPSAAAAADWGTDISPTITRAAAPAPAAPGRQTEWGSWGAMPSPAGGFGGAFGDTAAPSTSAPRIAPEEDFGGWSSAVPEPSPVPERTTTNATAMTMPKTVTANQMGQGGKASANHTEDLFGNVWG